MSARPFVAAIGKRVQALRTIGAIRAGDVGVVRAVYPLDVRRSRECAVRFDELPHTYLVNVADLGAEVSR